MVCFWVSVTLLCLGSLSANGWGCVPVLLVVWHRVSSTVACWSLSGAGSWHCDGDLWEIFAVCFFVVIVVVIKVCNLLQIIGWGDSFFLIFDFRFIIKYNCSKKSNIQWMN